MILYIVGVYTPRPKEKHTHTFSFAALCAMERVLRAFLFHEELATQDEGASLEEALEHVLWCVVESTRI